LRRERPCPIASSPLAATPVRNPLIALSFRLARLQQETTAGMQGTVMLPETGRGNKECQNV
jgi:hypothetical protein